jgi:uncharacterized protein
MTNRREFLSTTALATVTALASSVASAQTQRGGAAQTGGGAPAPASPEILVDWYSNYISNAEFRYLLKRKNAPRVVERDGKFFLENVPTVSNPATPPAARELGPSDINARLANLDKNNVRRQLLHQNTPLGYDATLPIEDQRVLFREINNEIAEVVDAHKDRFLGVAVLPAGDPRWAAEELDRAHKELGLLGASLPLNAFASLEAARTQAPVFAVGQNHRSHFFIHRGPVASNVPGQPPFIDPKDTEYARRAVITADHLANGAITLGLTDFLDPYPDVTVEISMLGGVFPYLWESLVPGAIAADVKDPLARLRRIYLDPGPYSRNAAWTLSAINVIGADRVLFGTDYGGSGLATGDVAPNIATLNAVLTWEQKNRLYRENSRELLRSKGIVI